MIVSPEQNVRLSCIRSQCTVPQLTYDDNKFSIPYVKHQSINIHHVRGIYNYKIVYALSLCWICTLIKNCIPI